MPPQGGWKPVSLLPLKAFRNLQSTRGHPSVHRADRSIQRDSTPTIRLARIKLLADRRFVKASIEGVVLKVSAAGALGGRLRTYFPDREFIMRSEGRVRFIRISSRLQIAAAAIAGLLLVGWLVTMAFMAFTQYAASRDRLALLDREARVASAESRVSTYRKGLDSVASDLERRQDFVDRMVQAHIGDLPRDTAPDENVSDSSHEAERLIDKVSAAVPEAAGLARLEARQLAFVERLTRFADRRAARAASVIRQLGLDPNIMLAELDDKSAQGGPLFKLATSADGALDPRFQRLGVSLGRMEAFERGLAGIPQVLPASLEFISSGFGYRSDPFTGGGAFHSGLDFRGLVGAPIYAAASGKVAFTGVKQGYGNCVEIDHGNGLMTRYAHMSRFSARVGDDVSAGMVIGAIGNTGRSTGPHLHFEVRINDRAVNPRPFLEAAPHVFKEARTAAQSRPLVRP
jgi:murein DD-endopeptidase MepM/ murein hydrolase activator NlpD